MKIKPHSMNQWCFASDKPTRSAVAVALFLALTGNAAAAEKQSQSINNSHLNNRVANNGSTAPAKKSDKQSGTPRQNNQKSQTDTTTLKTMTVVGEAVQDPNDPYNKDYTVTNSSTATKTDTPIMDTPTSLQIVPRAVMDDQKVTRITDALENVSGVRAQPSLGFGNMFIIRGFHNDNIYRNGLRANNIFPQEYDTANLQSIEVLKGPAHLYGRTEPGGLISLTTKKPLDIPYYSLEQRFGSYDLYRTEWDATGPVTSDKSLLYRFTGSYQNNNSFRDFDFTDRMLFAPSVTWRPTEATDATLELQVNNQDFMADFGIPVIGKRPAAIPISRSLGDPNTPASNLNQVQLSSLLNHRFNEDWAIHSRFLASFDGC